jgi:hypothetical protein
MPAEMIWYGLALLVAVTLYWAAVWWWLPSYFRDRDRDSRERKSEGKGDGPPKRPPGA